MRYLVWRYLAVLVAILITPTVHSQKPRYPMSGPVSTPGRLPSVCMDGTYRELSEFGSPWVPGCPGFKKCEPGFQCNEGIKKPCPPGTFSDTGGSSECNTCPAGRYCPQVNTTDTEIRGTINPIPCGNLSVYCPEGSSRPLIVPPGYETTNSEPESIRSEILLCPRGHFCTNGIRRACPMGTFGATRGISNSACSGPCRSGYFCGTASTVSDQFRCGSPAVYCPEGSWRPIPVSGSSRLKSYSILDGQMFYSVDENGDDSLLTFATRSNELICPIGFYCRDGLRFQCPPGRFGAEVGSSNPTCAGKCDAGFYCETGSASRQQNLCGNSSVYCPPGSEAPLQVSPGFYTVGNTSRSRTAQVECHRGSYCVDGIMHLCPSGHFGSLKGLSNRDCSGLCEDGYFCPRGSTSSRERKCGSAAHYCPVGSKTPKEVEKGYYSARVLPSTNFQFVGDVILTEAQADGYLAGVGGAMGRIPGINEVYARTLKDTVSFVDPRTASLRQSLKTSVSTSTEHFQMIFERLNEARIGKPNSSEIFDAREYIYAANGTFQLHPWYLALLASFSDPEDAASFHFGISDTSDINNVQLECDLGHYCIEGKRFACPGGTFGNTSKLSSNACSGKCSEGFFCPEGTIDANQFMCGSPQLFCPHGSSRTELVSSGFFSVGLTEHTAASQEICPEGFYCSRGKKFACPPGRYGNQQGLVSSSCSGSCASGYYCPPGSSSPQEKICENATVYCPEGVGFPVPVASGFYSVLGKTRETGGNIPKDQPMRCNSQYGRLGLPPEANFSVLHGPVSLSVIQFDETKFCVSGDIGDSQGRKGQAGCEPGSFCRNGLRYECPPGRFGSRSKEIRDLCTGDCHRGYFCPWSSFSAFQLPCGASNRICAARSGSPLLVPAGYYSVRDSDEQFRSAMRICPRGSFCPGDGNAHKCQPGRYGSIEGIKSPFCSGLCQRGYFCPGPGETKSTAFECGSVGKYCPTGADRPLAVPEGFYSQGGWERVIGRPENSTRWEVRRCSPGTFCTQGILRQCPGGTFGNSSESNRPLCDGICDAGYFCPPGSSVKNAFRCGDIFMSVNYTNEFALLKEGQAIGGGANGRGSSGASKAEASELKISLNNLQARIRQIYDDIDTLNHFSELASLNGSLTNCSVIFEKENMTLFEDSNATSYANSTFNGTQPSENSTSNGTEPALDMVDMPCDLGNASSYEFNLTVLETCLSNFFPNRTYHIVCDGVDVRPLTQIIAGLNYEVNISATVAENIKDLQWAISRIQQSLLLLEAQIQFLLLSGNPDLVLQWENGLRLKYPRTNLQIGEANAQGLIAEGTQNAVFCPAGSPIPFLVNRGFFSTDSNLPAGANNFTQDSQRKCPAGHYCIGGIVYPCIPGRFQTSEGSSSRFCEASCPAGFECPLGTSNPIACRENQYSGPGFPRCLDCPDEVEGQTAVLQGLINQTEIDTFFGEPRVMEQPPKCKTSRACCSS